MYRLLKYVVTEIEAVRQNAVSCKLHQDYITALDELIAALRKVMRFN